jgi:hypothetical protein
MVIAVVAAMAMGCTRASDGPVDLDEVIGAHVASLSPAGAYRDPEQAERDTTREAFGLLLAGTGDTKRPDDLLRGIGFRVTHGVDAADGRTFTMYLATGDTGWGGLIVDRSGPIRSLVEVPHPAFDLNTERLALSLYRTLPGAALLIAGAHRQAGGGKADVAHNDRSLFQVFSEEAAKRAVLQIQLHGFAERSLPGADAVVSTGAGPHNDIAVRVARELKAVGLQVCRAWVTRCKGLEGTTNVQAAATAAYDAEFVHLELGWSLRRDRSGRDQVRDAIVTAWPS